MNENKPKNTVFTSKNNILFILTVLIICFSLFLYHPKVETFIIDSVEKFFHKTLRNPFRWIDIIKHTSHICIAVALLLNYLSVSKSGIRMKNAISLRISQLVNQYWNRKTLYSFFLVCIFLFVAYFGIISANFFYSDDVFRNYGGDRSWIGFSRYISEFGSIFIHSSLRLNDIAPLTQFLAIAVSSAAILLLSFAITGTIEKKYLLSLSLIFIVPVYAENISYRFDSPYMALSLLFSAIPFLFRENIRTFSFVSVLSLILTCFSYQASLSLYILTTIFIFVKDTLEHKKLQDNFIFAASSVLAFVTALLLFKLFFMNTMTNDADSYFSTEIAPLSLFSNSLSYIKTTFSWHGGLFLKFLLIVSLILAVFMVFKSTKKYRLLKSCIAIPVLVVSYALSFGPYLIFQRPVFAARAFTGFGVFLAFTVLFNIYLSKQVSKKIFTFCRIILILSVYCCTGFLYSYGNALRNQNEYEQFRTQLILQDVSKFTEKTNKYNISIHGSIGLTEKNRILVKNYPLIKHILPVRPSRSHLWNEELFGSYNFDCSDKFTELTEEYVLVTDTYYHAIYQHDSSLIVVLH